MTLNQFSLNTNLKKTRPTLKFSFSYWERFPGNFSSCWKILYQLRSFKSWRLQAKISTTTVYHKIPFFSRRNTASGILFMWSLEEEIRFNYLIYFTFKKIFLWFFFVSLVPLWISSYYNTMIIFLILFSLFHQSFSEPFWMSFFQEISHPQQPMYRKFHQSRLFLFP